MKRILIFLISVLQISLLSATEFSCDYIYINGEKWLLMDKPLNRDSTVYANLKKFLPEERSISTGNQDGYTGYWTVADGKLYLQKIDVRMYSLEEKREYTRVYNVDSLKNLFTSYYDGKGICATWFKGKIRSGWGQTVRLARSGFDRNMEEEYVMVILDGVIAKQQLYHNYKKEGINQKDFQWELEKRFPFEQFPAYEKEKFFFFMRNLKASPDGHLLDCGLVNAKLPDERRITNDQQHPAIKAFKAAMKDIYPWEVLYVNGKYAIDCNNAVALYYPVLTAHTKDECLEPGASVCYLNMRKDTIIPFGKYKYCNSDIIRHIGFVLDKEIVCIDNKGNELFDVFSFDNGVDPVKEGLFRIKDKAGKMGFADMLGNIIIKPQFAFAFPFEDGKAKVTYSGVKLFIDERKEHWKWDSDYWFYIDTKGEYITDNLNIKSVREYVESNEFINIIPEQYYENLSNYVYSDDEKRNLDYQMKAAAYRFYKHCTMDEKGFITCHATSGEEMNMSEEVFEFRIREMGTWNKSIQENVDKGVKYRVIRIDNEQYLDDLLNYE